MAGPRPDLESERREQQALIDRETRRSVADMRPVAPGEDGPAQSLRDRAAELDVREDEVERHDTATRMREVVAEVRETAADRRDDYLDGRSDLLDARERHLDWRTDRLAELDDPAEPY